MFDSLKDWMDVPVQFRTFIKRDGAGDKTFQSPHSIDTYPVHESKYVRNALGADILTNHHFYIDGANGITTMDEVLVDGEWLQIQSIDTYFREGVPDVKVVHA